MQYETMIVKHEKWYGQTEYTIYNIRENLYSDKYKHRILEDIIADYNLDGWNIVPYPTTPDVVLAMSRIVEG